MRRVLLRAPFVVVKRYVFAPLSPSFSFSSVILVFPLYISFYTCSNHLFVVFVISSLLLLVLSQLYIILVLMCPPSVLFRCIMVQLARRCKALQQNCIVVATGTLTPAFPVLCFRQGGLSFTGMGHKSLPHQFTSRIRLTAGLGQTHHPWEENAAGLWMRFWCWFYRFAFHSLTIFSFYVYVFFLFFHTQTATHLYLPVFFFFFSFVSI